MATKHSRFDLEWWVVPKRFVHIAVTVVALGLAVGGAAMYVWMHGNPFSRAYVVEPPPAGARFDLLDGSVRVVRASTRETLSARSDTQLYPGDIVQTQADGRARILLVDGSTLLVRPNSVVTIRDNTSVEGSGRTHVRVAVDRGQINVRTEQQTTGTTNVIETKLTENRLTAQTGASFGVRDDNTEEISVSTGSVETSTSSGDRTIIRSGEYLAVDVRGAVAHRERLLGTPVLLVPRDLEKIAAKANNAANVTLRWQRPAAASSATHYQVEVATSPFFVEPGKVIQQDRLATAALDAGSLRSGIYFWRVRSTTDSGQTSEWSEPRKFVIAPPGGTGERVSVGGMVAEYIAGSVYIVRGRAQPGTTIRIGGRTSLAAGDGTFQLQITVPREAREVTVAAEDSQGNQSRYQLALPAKARMTE